MKKLILIPILGLALIMADAVATTVQYFQEKQYPVYFPLSTWSRVIGSIDSKQLSNAIIEQLNAQIKADSVKMRQDSINRKK